MATVLIVFRNRDFVDVIRDLSQLSRPPSQSEFWDTQPILHGYLQSLAPSLGIGGYPQLYEKRTSISQESSVKSEDCKRTNLILKTAAARFKLKFQKHPVPNGVFACHNFLWFNLGRLLGSRPRLIRVPRNRTPTLFGLLSSSLCISCCVWFLTKSSSIQ